MGAPGSFYWAGTVKVLNLTDNMYLKLNDEVIMNRRYTYLGEYSGREQVRKGNGSDSRQIHKLLLYYWKEELVGFDACCSNDLHL